MDKDTEKDPEFHPEVVKACRKYATAYHNAGKAHWKRASLAHEIKATAETHGQHYIKAATSLCGVERSVIVMDAMADGMRRWLRYEIEQLPVNSLSAFYELHRGFEIAMLVAGEGRKAKEAAKLKAKKIGQAIKGGASVREVKRAFAEERKSLQEMKRSARPAPKPEEDRSHPPRIEQLDAEGMKNLVAETCIPTGLAVPVVRIVPSEPTPQAVEACFADEKTRTVISEACPTKGNLWILVDLKTVEKAQQAEQTKKTEGVVKGLRKNSKGGKQKAA